MNRIRSACNGGFIGQWKGPPPHLIICYIFNRQTASLLLWPANNIHHSFEKWFGCQFGLQDKCVLEFSLGYLRMVCDCLPLDCKQKHIRNLFYIKTHNHPFWFSQSNFCSFLHFQVDLTLYPIVPNSTTVLIPLWYTAAQDLMEA